VICRPVPQVQQLEFVAHPLMAPEERAASTLLAAYSAYKRRESAGAVTMYADQLAGVEDALLATRHLLLLHSVRSHALHARALQTSACCPNDDNLPAPTSF
jgi:hypothetical protein